MEVLFWLVGITIGAWVGGIIGGKRDRQTAGMVLGGLLGIFGWLLILALDPGPKAQCPKCKKRTVIGASICSFCRTELSA